uniref:Uncharacterized protein n=1 Tax=Aegilops tauschii subsp. strangulata TaxID=200361 RepID=A0A453QKR5_AEGTS
MRCTEVGVQASTIHGPHAMNKYFVTKATPLICSIVEMRHRIITTIMCYMRREIMN